jgi:hypothetical protein
VQCHTGALCTTISHYSYKRVTVSAWRYGRTSWHLQTVLDGMHQPEWPPISQSHKHVTTVGLRPIAKIRCPVGTMAIHSAILTTHLLSQQVCPLGHLGGPHLPSLQPIPGVHRLLYLPQCSLLVTRSCGRGRSRALGQSISVVLAAPRSALHVLGRVSRPRRYGSAGREATGTHAVWTSVSHGQRNVLANFTVARSHLTTAVAQGLAGRAHTLATVAVLPRLVTALATPTAMGLVSHHILQYRIP